jgi:hypothetical protein
MRSLTRAEDEAPQNVKKDFCVCWTFWCGSGAGERLRFRQLCWTVPAVRFQLGKS